MIRETDRLSTVLDRDEQLLDVLTEAVPSLEALRSESMRRNMAPRVTVAQAAQLGGLEVADLLARLNGASRERPPSPKPEQRAAPSGASTPVPAALLATPPALLVDVDVREDLRSGIEPFSRIMGAVQALSPENVLRIRAIFEPAPLYGVLAKKGFAHFTEQLAPDDWRVWFYRDEAAASAPKPARAAAEGEDVIVLDVRDLEPPEPMVRTLEALETMPRGKTLLQINVRVPQFLLPKLEERGFAYEIREQARDVVRVFIKHKTD